MPMAHVQIQEPNMNIQPLLIENVEKNNEGRVPDKDQEHVDHANVRVPSPTPIGNVGDNDEALVQENKLSTKIVPNEGNDFSCGEQTNLESGYMRRQGERQIKSEGTEDKPSLELP